MKLSEQVAEMENERATLRELYDEQRRSIQRLSEELATRPQVDPDRYARLETLLDLVSEDIEWQELHRADSPKFKPLITLYRELRPKEAKRADWSAKTFGPADDHPIPYSLKE